MLPSWARPETTRPSPSSAMPWWWWEWMSSTASPSTPAVAVPGSVVTRWRPNVPSCGRCGARSSSARAMSWTSVPPRSTLISCRPRQMPSTGRPRSPRAAEQGELERVAHAALGRRLVRSLLELGAVQRGVEIGPAREDQPVDAVEHLAGILGAVGRRREQDRHAAGQAHALDVALRDDRRLELPVRPARVRAVRADADAGPAHRRSKERRSSQSVTAASKASSSTVAALR